MTIISFADEYRRRVGLRVRYLRVDGRPMSVAEYRVIPQDDTSDDAGVVVGWVNLRCERCTALKRKRMHIVWQRDEDGALRITHWGVADRRIKQWKIPQLFVLGHDGDGNDPDDNHFLRRRIQKASGASLDCEQICSDIASA
jgi:hypothetical protein